VSTIVSEPLASNYPSPMLFLNYPLIAANIRLLCGADGPRSRGSGSSSLKGMLRCLRRTYEVEGFFGLYRGSHIYLLHHAVRDSSRFLAEKAFQFVEGPQEDEVEERSADGTGSTGTVAKKQTRKQFAYRVLTKYAIEALSYPLLLASTRAVVMKLDGKGFWEHLGIWLREDGFLSLFGGLLASLSSTGLEEIMDHVLSWCIDYCASGQEIEVADKVLLKASGSSVVSILTAPVNYIGIIRRCQSHSMGVPREGTFELLRSLPWYSSFQQFLFFSGIMALNVKLVAMKVQLKQEQEERQELDPE